MSYKYIPDTMNIETVLGCNARCIMCTVESWSRKHGMMPEAVFETILEQMGDFKENLRSVALFLDGEPLVDRFLEHRIIRCKSADIPQVGFTTNGSLFNPNRTHDILEAEPDWIVFSLDSMEKETFEKIRVRLKFERVQENVHEVIRQRNKKKKKTRIIARFIEQDYNRGQFDEFKEYFSQLLNNSKDEIHFSGTHNWALGNGDGFDYGNTSCGYLDGKFVVFRDGQVPLCCIDFDGANMMGSIMNHHILEIFNSDSFNRARIIHKKGLRASMEVCRTCDVPETNRKGVLSRKITPSGREMSSDVFTPFDNEEVRENI